MAVGAGLVSAGPALAAAPPATASNEAPQPSEPSASSDENAQTDTSAPSEPGPPPSPSTPEDERDRGREILDYWGRGPLYNDVVFVGGHFVSARGPGLPDYRLGGARLNEDHQFGAAFGFMFHPRVYLELSFARERWSQDGLALTFQRLEVRYLLDLLALPNWWRVRPALNVIAGAGLGWGRVDPGRSPDDESESPAVFVRREGVGGGGTFGVEVAVHVRLTQRVELAPYAGVTVPVYAVDGGHPYTYGRIGGQLGFGRAPRWHAGLKVGFGAQNR